MSNSETPNAIKVTPEMIRAVTEYMQKVQTVTFKVECQSCGHPECKLGHYVDVNDPSNAYIDTYCSVCARGPNAGPCSKVSIYGRK